MKQQPVGMNSSRYVLDLGTGELRIRRVLVVYGDNATVGHQAGRMSEECEQSFSISMKFPDGECCRCYDAETCVVHTTKAEG
jgi:hypothetical protein